MTAIITSDLIEASSQCRRKAFFICRGEPTGDEHVYVQIMRLRESDHRGEFRDSVVRHGSDSHDQWARLIICPNGLLETGDLRADCMEVFPQLGTPRRVYRRAQEPALWDLSRVDAFWAQGCWRRRADGNGAISIYGDGRAVGRTWARQELVVRFDAPSRCWLVCNQNGELVKQFPANERTRERIIALAVSRRR